jgi:hypothetical protein
MSPGSALPLLCLLISADTPAVIERDYPAQLNLLLRALPLSNPRMRHGKPCLQARPYPGAFV